MRLRLRFSIMSITLLAAAAASGQTPKLELFGGYSYMRSNAVLTDQRINLHGASFSGAFYVHDWLGVVADVGGYHAGSIANQFSLMLWSYQFGPRVRLRNDGRFTPYAQFLFGGGHAGGTLYTRSLGFGIPPIGTNDSFLYTASGGVDCRLSKRISIRIVQAEYLHSEFLNGSASGHLQNNLRLSTGLVFKFGKT